MLSDLGYTATRLAEELQVQRSGISHMLSGRNQPSYDFISRLLKRFPNVDARWLILGEGTMYLTEITEKNIHHPSSLILPQTKSEQSEAGIPGEGIPVKVTNVTAINKVLLLYPDGTFEFFMQRT